ncbi:ArdC family protein [Aeoliella sp.]|uniref:ArdC family protein n=1 Tax=Aeoliella sp. TaxID=2795800 RepID=UPI003CCBFB14
MAKRQPKRDIYQEIQEKILEYLDKGVPPWRHPIMGRGGAGFPTSMTTGKRYRGINVFLLALTAWMEGYGSSHWLTYKQAKECGGSVKKGEKGTGVIFWRWFEKENADTGDVDRLPVLRHYTVFNAEQCDGVTAPDQIPEEPLNDFTPIQRCEQILAGYRNPPTIEHRGKAACYLPREDKIRIAEPERFVTTEDYYATLWHECVHSTGAEKRLNREAESDIGGHVFGSPEYGKEELVAEMGAAFLCAHAGISPPTIENAASYIDGWRKKINGDKKLVILAAAKGQAAADYILGVTFNDAAHNDLIPQKPPHKPNPSAIPVQPTPL